ncbi:hypothetical protein [Paractinoplanes rishiriensis]|uniref:Uncharacterized protein n=1 Tax=Paractinoplanes rishiriensis TaxID=1050105 RepID=A0A919JX71_9ACTN|nr:hypothetical protein [Actinoplanes rishiriensis]GIE95279.1 hypothetical protein Ari01nite_27440 [Actinoplanes rishiriensis]
MTTTAASWADAEVAAVRDSPHARLALHDRTYNGPTGVAPRHLPYRRAARSFIRWQLRRGLLEPTDSSRPGSPWWRAVNKGLLRDGCEAIALLAGHTGRPSTPAVRHWLDFAERPTAVTWYRAHNASIVAGYLRHRELALNETAAERFFMNVILLRVLYAHTLNAAPRLSLSWLRPLAPLLGDPRLGMTGIFLQLSRILPATYPLTEDVAYYTGNELGFGRLLDYGVILPRLHLLYEWSAAELGTPGLLELIQHGYPAYAGSGSGDTRVWIAQPSWSLRLTRTLLPAPHRDNDS